MLSNLMFEKIYTLSIITCIIIAIAFTFILPYSSYLYKKLIEIEPDFFQKRNTFYLLTKINSTQFVFYIIGNCYKNIKNIGIRKKCYFLRNILYILVPLFFISVIIGIIGNYVFP